MSVALLVVCLGSAQEPRFDARSRLVVVPVTVTDVKGHSIAGLEPSDFRVLDNGVVRAAVVDTIDTGVAPIALVMAVQSAGISAAVVEKVRKIGSMIQPLLTGERGSVALVSFDQKVNWLQDFTKDSRALDKAFEKLRPELHAGEDKEARMLDAVSSAVEHLAKVPNARRVLLLISETRDRGSETPLEKTALAVQTAGVAVYAATYSAFKTGFTSKGARTEPRRAIKPKMPTDVMGTQDGKPGGKFNQQKPPPEMRPDMIPIFEELIRRNKENAAEVLTKGSGGAIFTFTRQRALEEAIDKLSGELHSQYVLSFVPEGATTGFHKLEVVVARPADAQVRARPGYWAQ